MQSLYLLQAEVAARGASLRMLAAILLLVLLCGLFYVLLHVKSFKAEVNKGARGLSRPGARSNVMFIACALAFVVICILLFLVAKA